MLSKNEVKYIQSLGHKKQRDEEQVFIAEGPKMAAELLQNSFAIAHIYALKEWISENEKITPIVTEVSPVELQKISNLTTANEVLIIAKQKQLPDEPILPGTLTLVLDGIQDPGNMGTIIRIADWFGVHQIVASNDTVEAYNPKVVQSTMGSICRVNVWYKEMVPWLANVKMPVYGALMNGESIYKLPKPTEGLLAIGNEGHGIRPSIIEKITHPITIPRVGEAESLNAAVATGIILSHLTAS